jgi:hypothetical protein
MNRVWVQVFAVLLGVGAGVSKASTFTIDFSGLAGSNGDSFTSYAQGGFTVSVISGTWFVAQFFGNPTPDIFNGPIDSPTGGQLRITGSGPFSFVSADLVSQNGTSNYSFTGDSGSAFTQTGTVPASATFSTVSSSSSASITTLDYFITPGSGASSSNIDNIVLEVGAVASPLPSSAWMGLCLFGAVGIGRVFVRRGRAAI